jgi:hypothetical protein
MKMGRKQGQGHRFRGSQATIAYSSSEHRSGDHQFRPAVAQQDRKPQINQALATQYSQVLQLW